MAIANLHETLLSYKLRENQLNLELTNLQSLKRLATYSQADLQSSLAAEKKIARDNFKELFENDETLQENYLDYTQIPDFEEEIDRITAEFQDKLDEMAAWETNIDAQITTNSAELEEIKAYKESVKSMLTTDIQEDFNFGLNG